MIIRKNPNGALTLIGQTDHSRFVGQLAAHWGNGEFETPKPYDSVVRAATFHDYGWLRYETSRPSRIATVPIGYADGVPRELSHHGGDVVIRGRRLPIAGTVTMDQLMVDAGDEPVEVGDDVVLVGRQGEEVITAQEWAELTGTIAYTIVCGVGPRVPRRYLP